MKLRVKLQRQSQIIHLENREPSEVTLGELKGVVAQNFGFPDIPSSNGPARSLSSNDTHEPSQRLSDVSMVTVDSSTSATVQERLDIRMDNQDNGQPYENLPSESQVNRFLLEPLVVRESTATQVPALLEQLYLSATCGCAADAVWVVVHTLMLETGFIPQQVSDLTQIPTGWKQSGYYKCAYELHFSGKEPGKCSIAGVPMASSLIVHGLTSTDESFKTEHLQLKPADFVTGLSDNVPEVYVALDRLSSQVKDTICLPLENELATAAGLPGGQGFTSLPYEIKVRILSFLDAVTLCHVAQTGTNLSILAKEKSVWRRLYIRDFGKPENSTLNRDWYELYKEEFLRRREADQRRREFGLDRTESLLGFRGALRPFPNPGMRFPPDMIGGDYDLNPQFFTGGVPNPMGSGQGRRPGPILPNVGIPDPFGGDPLGLGIPGRPGRGNMTGSPFSHGGRGSMFRSPFM
ncbi:F-box only protein 7 [Plakobranchus ocellatus]|uniref:F-box only protein 7 n=1 Tax=Plakobranchus ocellatus TaxID=259542 RepID=A0AAV3Z269_9GAST|nr:F-box only protein 7 [Plakobranchus ocellatus]